MGFFFTALMFLLPSVSTDSLPEVEDTPVSCVFMETCILPCSSVGPEALVHWIQVSRGNLPVHSFFNNKDQLGRQDEMYRNRTSLFVDQISRGNASLQLRDVKVQDQGIYKCYTSTFTGNKESFENLSVIAPVHQVDLVQNGEGITCNSSGIYPRPELNWSTEPPTNLVLQEPDVLQNGEKLYSISSFLNLSDSYTDLKYICNVRTDSSSRTTTLSKMNSVSGNPAETTIPCSTSHALESSSHLVWRFNHSQMILTRTRAEASPTISDGWRQQVEGVSESGSLTLKDLSQHHEGIYTCEARDAEETLITNTFVRIQAGPDKSGIIIALAVVLGVVVPGGAAIALWIYCCRRKGQKKKEPSTQENTESMLTERGRMIS